jgi:hypothetical protein
MLDCMADATASAMTTNWFSALSGLLQKVLADIESATIDVALEWVEVDVQCMHRWRTLAWLSL